MLRRLLLLLSLSTIAATSFTSTAFADRSFTPRFSQNLPGNIAVAANVLTTCNPAGANGSNCVASRTDTGLGLVNNGNLNNNGYDMINIDIDSDSATANSSSATLDYPTSGQVVWAGLYWASNAPSGMTEAEAKSIKLRGPDDSSYQSLTATSYDAAPMNSLGYDCFLDVTSIVQAQEAGVWTAAGVSNRPEAGTQAGWSLVVVYKDSNETPRNLTVFDGQATVSGSAVVDIPVNGFQTPPTGTVDAIMGMITFEGDRGIVGDYAELNGTRLSDAKHLDTNFFNSWFADKGTSTTGRNPDYTNQLGFDASLIDVPGIIGNNDTSATISTKTSGDVYEPLVVTSGIDLFAPSIDPNKSVQDLNGGEVRLGDILEYTIDLENTGGDGATNAVFKETAMPSNTSYVGSSATLDGVAPDPALIDQPADAGTGPLTIRVGTGASAVAGGTIAAGESHQVKFRVRVTAPLPIQDAVISNQALFDYTFYTLGDSVEVPSNSADIVVHRPDLAMSKTMTSAHFADGYPGQYTLSVSNVGKSDTQDPVTVTDTLPTQFASPTVSSATGWSCSIVARLLTCNRSDALAATDSYPNIVIDSPLVNIPGGETVVNTAAVDGGDLDADPTNDSSTVSTSQQGVSTLAVDNQAAHTNVIPGQTIDFTASYSNTGPSTAVNPTLQFETTSLTTADVELVDYTVTSSNSTVHKSDCAVSSPSNKPTIICSPAALAKDATVQITVTLRPLAATTQATMQTKATISAANDIGSPKNDLAAVDIDPTADLGLAKTVQSPTAERGASVNYTLTVNNAGPSVSGPVGVTDSLPAGLAPQTATWSRSAGGASGSCVIVASTRSVICSNMSTISSSQTITILIAATVSNTATGYQTNTAQAQSSVADPDVTNNTASVQLLIIPAADLTISKTGPSSLAPEQTGVYSIKVVNHGPSSAHNVVVTDQMDSRMILLSQLPSGCLLVSHKVTCQVGTLANAASKTYRFRVKIKSSAKTGRNMLNTAIVTSSTPDPDPSNQTDQVQTTVSKAARPRLAIHLSVPQHAVQVWQSVKLRVRIKNLGYATIHHPKACITIPDNLWGIPQRHVCWTTGNLYSRRTRDFSVTVLARSNGTRTVRAGTEASNAWWIGDRQTVSVRGGFTG